MHTAGTENVFPDIDRTLRKDVVGAMEKNESFFHCLKIKNRQNIFVWLFVRRGRYAIY